MIFNCVICSDIFDSGSDTHITTCGHLFHYVCLIEWLERSKSCPQCRNKTTEKSIFKVFFNVQNDGKEDAGSLRNQIENLKFAVQMKELELKNTADEVKTMRTRNVKLRGEFMKFEQKVASLDLANVSLKDQINYLKKQVKEGENAKDVVRELRTKLEILQNVELAVRGTLPEVEAMLSNYIGTNESQKAMFTYTTVLKRELNVAMERKREMRSKIDLLQRSLSTVQGEVELLRTDCKSKEVALRQLEEDLKRVTEEKKGLLKVVQDLEQTIVSPSANPRNTALQFLIEESSISHSVKQAIKRPKLTDPSKDSQESKVVLPSKPMERSKMMCLQGELSNVGLSVLHTSRLTNFSRCTSLFRDVPRTSPIAHDEAYDGLGGHSRRDDFPIPIAGARPKLRAAPLRKKVPLVNTLDAFINLT